MTYPKGYEAVPGGLSDTYESLTSKRNETTIWFREIKKGIFRRKVIGMEKITTYAVYDSSGHAITLFELDDVIIMNQHGTTQSQFIMASSGRFGSRTGFGTGQSQSRRIADLTFIRNGIPEITFKHLDDCSGIKQLTLSAKKALLEKGNS